MFDNAIITPQGAIFQDLAHILCYGPPRGWVVAPILDQGPIFGTYFMLCTRMLALSGTYSLIWSQSPAHILCYVIPSLRGIKTTVGGTVGGTVAGGNK